MLLFGVVNQMLPALSTATKIGSLPATFGRVQNCALEEPDAR